MEVSKVENMIIVSSRVLKTENGYGLFVCVDARESRVYPDLSVDYGRICAFSDLINQGEVSALHIEELIDDFLG